MSESRVVDGRRSDRRKEGKKKAEARAAQMAYASAQSGRRHGLAGRRVCVMYKKDFSTHDGGEKA